MPDTHPNPRQLQRWQWRSARLTFPYLVVIALTSLAGAHDAGRDLTEATIEGLFSAIIYAPFFALCGVQVEPKPRWWKAATLGVFGLWFGLVPAIAGWVLDYYTALSGALIAGSVFFLFITIIAVAGETGSE